MIYFYYATIFETIDKWLGLDSIVGFFNAVLFSLLTAMTMLTYIMGIMSDPGTVPLRYKDLENPDISLHESKKVFLCSTDCLLNSMCFWFTCALVKNAT